MLSQEFRGFMVAPKGLKRSAVASPYVAEEQSALWTSEGVHQFFHDAGFDVREWPLTQHLERDLPTDSVFYAPSFSKLFGFQYKTVYRNGADHWQLNREQHRRLQDFPWIYYCCSELREVADSRVALHLTRVYSTRFNYQPRLGSGFFEWNRARYIRWGAFYQQLRRCRAGLRIKSREDLEEALRGVRGEARLREVGQMGELLLANFDKRVVVAGRLL